MDKQILGPVKQEKWGKTYSAARVISVTAISGPVSRVKTLAEIRELFLNLFLPLAPAPFLRCHLSFWTKFPF